jgi:hypothetical protein
MAVCIWNTLSVFSCSYVLWYMRFIRLCLDGMHCIDGLLSLAA